MNEATFVSEFGQAIDYHLHPSDRLKYPDVQAITHTGRRYRLSLRKFDLDFLYQGKYFACELKMSKNKVSFDAWGAFDMQHKDTDQVEHIPNNGLKTSEQLFEEVCNICEEKQRKRTREHEIKALEHIEKCGGTSYIIANIRFKGYNEAFAWRVSNYINLMEQLKKEGKNSFKLKKPEYFKDAISLGKQDGKWNVTKLLVG